MVAWSDAGSAPAWRPFRLDETSQRTYKRHCYYAQLGKWRGGPIPYGLQPDSAGWFESLK
jgi:hypothetical protein